MHFEVFDDDPIVSHLIGEASIAWKDGAFAAMEEEEEEEAKGDEDELVFTDVSTAEPVPLELNLVFMPPQG